MKYILIILTTFVILGLLIFDSMFGNIGKPTYRKIRITTTKNSDVIFLKTKNWGVNGDSQITIITEKDEEKFNTDTNSNYVFKNIDPFLYKVSNDTLFLYLFKRIENPPHLNSNWKIIQNEIKNSEFSELRKNKEYKHI